MKEPLNGARSVAPSNGSCHPPFTRWSLSPNRRPLRTGGFYHLPELAGRPQGFGDLSCTTPLPCASPRLWGQLAVSMGLIEKHGEDLSSWWGPECVRTVSNKKHSLVNKRDAQVNKTSGCIYNNILLFLSYSLFFVFCIGLPHIWPGLTIPPSHTCSHKHAKNHACFPESAESRPLMYCRFHHGF